MDRSLETGKNLGRGVDWLRVGLRTLYHLTWPLGARTGGAGRARNASPGEQRNMCIPHILGHHQKSWNLLAMESSALPLGNECL